MTFLELSKTLISLLILLTILKIIPATKTAFSSLRFKKKYIDVKKGDVENGNANGSSDNGNN